jgi:hypothetical protein
VIALIHTGSVSLTKWVTHVPCRGVFAQSTQRRIGRWLYNPRINIHRLYKPLIQRSEIRSVVALSRLWFILAVATLYVTAQGDEVVARRRRRWIDTHWFRGNSYFRIAWEWVKAAWQKG